MTAVITGIGVTAPTGLGAEAHWAAILAGRSGIRPLTRFDTGPYPARLAGEVPGFDPAAHLPSRLIPQTDLMTQLSLVAADWALADAGLTPGDLPDLATGVVTAASTGGFEFGQRVMQNMWARGPKHVSAYQAYAWFYAVNSGQISIRHGLRGPSGVTVTEAAGGLDALAQARRQLRKDCRMVLAGAVDSSFCSFGLVSQLSTGRLSTATDPASAYLPFDERAGGHVHGEGGALLVLEDKDSALARGAHAIYGELAGYGSTMDGARPGLRRAIEIALDDAGVWPTEVDVVFADAAALPELDRAEAAAISEVFGAGQVPVTAPKTMTGRLNAGGGPLDVATALLAMRDGRIPPTVNVRQAPGHDLDLVTGPARRARLRTAVVLARGLGGFNSAVVLRANPRLPAKGQAA